jgi:hypothetical protein
MNKSENQGLKRNPHQRMSKVNKTDFDESRQLELQLHLETLGDSRRNGKQTIAGKHRLGIVYASSTPS